MILPVSGFLASLCKPAPLEEWSKIWGYIPAWLYDPGYAAQVLNEVIKIKFPAEYPPPKPIRQDIDITLASLYDRGLLGMFALHGGQDLKDPLSEQKITYLVTQNAMVSRVVGTI